MNTPSITITFDFYILIKIIIVECESFMLKELDIIEKAMLKCDKRYQSTNN